MNYVQSERNPLADGLTAEKCAFVEFTRMIDVHAPGFDDACMKYWYHRIMVQLPSLVFNGIIERFGKT
ncbi:hypothetical protein FOXB_14532 [Fusarium oxysporum f. sp. conglutinans Fo5176]|uniref:Uncharacterized protein n=1 Tax=Fusarium oxysporum (strain Fo5176) TaxID=660025 RepID=F9G7A0_FUSOF|nr:hypothetical protein FOXB_14532 [Fusarium oxysporum f. sp. conglutinans Fo5176]